MLISKPITAHYLIFHFTCERALPLLEKKKVNHQFTHTMHRAWGCLSCNVIDSKALNRPLNPSWRMNTNSTELPVIILHLNGVYLVESCWEVLYAKAQVSR